jgi:hypothetical protein
MEPSTFDELEFFRAIQQSGARALLIGRRALVLLGLPVLTAEYDLILIKQIAARPKDLEDIRLLGALRSERQR